jgi:hypothetical protein
VTAIEFGKLVRRVVLPRSASGKVSA